MALTDQDFVTNWPAVHGELTNGACDCEACLELARQTGALR